MSGFVVRGGISDFLTSLGGKLDLFLKFLFLLLNLCLFP